MRAGVSAGSVSWRLKRLVNFLSPLPGGKHGLVIFAVACFGSGCFWSMFGHVIPVVIDEQLRVFLGGGGNSTVLLHGREALVTDVKFGDYARRLEREVEQVLGANVRRVMVTHSHIDHAGGLRHFAQAGALIVHPNTRKRLEADGVRAPFVEVEREISLELGGETVRFVSLGRGHTDGDLVALYAQRRLLVAGDLVVNRYEPGVDVDAGGDWIALGRTLEAMLALPFDRLVPGHGEVMDRAEVVAFKDYVVGLGDRVTALVAQGKSTDEVVAAVGGLPEGWGQLSPGLHEANMRALDATVRKLNERPGPK